MIRRLLERAARAVARAAGASRGADTARDRVASFEDVVQSLGDGVALYGPDDRLVWFNRRFRELRHMNPMSCQIGAHFGDILRSAVACGGA